MITVSKPKLAPAILSGRGVTENTNNCDLYDANPAKYNSNKLKFKILTSIYNEPTVKKILKKAQYKKCCFCEKMQNDEDAAIEHYRPKLGYKSNRSDKIKKPGYYWLGYTWENLFFICKPCNTKKGNIFPIADETTRAKNHTMNIASERPLILNPTGTGLNNPRKHINFIKEFPKGISNEGKATVEACMLDREGLNIERRAHIDELDDRILTIIDNSHDLTKPAVQRAINYLKKSTKKEAKFSAMAIDYINNESPILIT